ncbi:hypothetical protein QPK87_20045 [Kamptonema cortianum]|nr:hypothetical protein [Geitlerinema splendidum]MDK3158851.1 hypothetical protein [Kamptonema cortianum]
MLTILTLALAQSISVTVNSPAEIDAQIVGLQPKKLAWRQINWETCLFKGMKQSEESGKPIILWAFINPDPTEERC